MADADDDPIIAWRFVLAAVFPSWVGIVLARSAQEAAQGFLWFRAREEQTLLAAAAVSLVAVQQPAEHSDHCGGVPCQGKAAVTRNPGQHVLSRVMVSQGLSGSMFVLMVRGGGTAPVRGNRACLDDHVIEVGKGVPQTVSGFIDGLLHR